MPVSGSPLVFGHRGVPGQARCAENTLGSFVHAMRLGADGVELDVRLTADDEVVVFHDAALVGVDEAGGFIHELTLDEIREVDPGIPTLADVLDWAAGSGAYLNVELKNLPGWDRGGRLTPDLALAVADEARLHRMQDMVVLSSFNLDDLRVLRSACPDVAVALLSPDGVGADPCDAVALADAEGLFGVHPHYEDLRGAALGRTLRAVADSEHCHWLMPWTVNAAEDLRRLMRAGVGGVITDLPDVAARVRDE